MSLRHANFFLSDSSLVVADESSGNGIYIRIRGARPIDLGDRFLIGEQVLEVCATLGEGAVSPTRDGTYQYSSPIEAAPYRVVQRLRGGDTGLAFCAQSNTVTIGRDGNDMNFPDDPFISGRHAQVSHLGDEGLQLRDLGSRNGTFVRVNAEATLEHGDYVFRGNSCSASRSSDPMQLEVSP